MRTGVCGLYCADTATATEVNGNKLPAWYIWRRASPSVCISYLLIYGRSHMIPGFTKGENEKVLRTGNDLISEEYNNIHNFGPWYWDLFLRISFCNLYIN